ncbi:glycine receptor subunit alpha-3 [Elysia marginata]|uniref:Glycine receptor subunit alpha-3 n=1 Tax=Elysia marginata TaxID=1093978 RepID=A0AAV4I3H6_9GAST|nr:glycine receptor subunit alpha-3 [Elysia marginata]
MIVLLHREAAIQKVISHNDPKIPPDFEKDYPTVIKVQVFLVSFASISETTMDYAVSIYLRQSWLDPRATYDPLPGVDLLEMDARLMNEIWVPDMYFVNEKKAYFHEITVPNKLMQVYPNGTIMYSARLTMTLSCDMFLQKFPFDSQECFMNMESYSYSVKNVIFIWHEEPLLLKKDLKLPQFKFIKMEHINCTKAYEGTGTYTCLQAKFYLERTYGYYVAQVFLPCILIVVLSWVSFWLDIDAVPARISLGLLTVLTMTTMSANARAHLPRVSYIKAIDVWMAMCLFFVFAALIEFAYVNVNARVEKRRTNQAGGLQLNFSPGGGSPAEKGEGKKKRLFSKTTIGRDKARRLDKLSRYIFPAIFICFNIFYWTFYMLWEPEQIHED